LVVGVHGGICADGDLLQLVPTPIILILHFYLSQSARLISVRNF